MIGRKQYAKKEKKGFAKFWDFLWNSNSPLSWFLDLIIIYIFVKFLFFPALSFMLGTSMPSLIVESESMIHQGDFEQWWSNYGGWYTENNITKEQAREWIFNNGINKGDIVVLVGNRGKPYNLNIGDVIVFNAYQPVPIIHRVVYNDTYFATKGDNNQGQLGVEKQITQTRVIGKAVLRIPKLGWGKLFFVEIGKKLFR